MPGKFVPGSKPKTTQAKPSMPIIEREFDVADWGDVDPPQYDTDLTTVELREEQLRKDGVELLSPTSPKQIQEAALRRGRKGKTPDAQFEKLHPRAKGAKGGQFAKKAAGSIGLESKLPLPLQVIVWDNDNSSTSPGSPVIHLAKWAADLLLHGKPGDVASNQMPWAMAIYTLYHEFWHTAMQETDEKNTDLGALTIMRDMMRKYWGLSAAEAQTQYEQVAGIVGQTGPARTPYHPEYTPNAQDPLLGDVVAELPVVPDRSWSEVKRAHKV